MRDQAAGWQVDALANYEQARLVLLENFGAEPGTRLQDIYRTLLSQTADAPAPTVKNSVSPSAASGPRVRLRLSLAAVLVVLLLRGHRISWRIGDRGRFPRRDLAAGHRRTDAPKILFGLGADAIPAERSPLIASGIGMITTWYHKSDQLDQFEGWRADVIPRIYGYGRAMHLVVATWGDGESIDTRFGRACGQAYPLSRNSWSTCADSPALSPARPTARPSTYQCSMACRKCPAQTPDTSPMPPPRTTIWPSRNAT